MHGIVHQHHGRITVEAAPGRGTTVTIFLPRTREPLANVASTPVEPSPMASPLKVLLVEDDAAVRQVTHDLLSSLGHEVVEAADGSEALRVAKRESLERIQLVITDVVMPRMSGFDLCDALRREGSRASVIFMSGYGNGAGAELAPGQRLLTKPFTRTALQRAIREVMAAGGAGRAGRP